VPHDLDAILRLQSSGGAVFVVDSILGNTPVLPKNREKPRGWHVSMVDRNRGAVRAGNVFLLPGAERAYFHGVGRNALLPEVFMGHDSDQSETGRFLEIPPEQVPLLKAGATPPPPNPTPGAGELKARLSENASPIHIQGPYEVADPLELRSIEFGHGLEIRDVVFRSRVDFSDVTFHRTVDLRGCIFAAGLVLEGACFKGSLIIDDVIAGRDAGDAEGRAVRMQLIRVDGALRAQGLIARGGVDLARANIRGNLEIATATTERLAQITGTLDLSSAEVGGTIRLNAIHLYGRLGAEGLLAGSHVKLGPLRERNESDAGGVLATTLVTGDVSFSGARVNGQLNLICVWVMGFTNLQSAEIHGGLYARCKFGHRPLFSGKVHAFDVRIDGAVDFCGAALKGDLSMERAKITGTVFFSDGWLAPEGPPPGKERNAPDAPDLSATAEGTVSLAQSVIAGTVEVLGARITKSLNLGTASVTGNVKISRSHIGADLDLRSITLRGELLCTCCDGTRATVGGRVLCRAARIASGASFMGVDVTGDVDMAGSTFSGRLSLCQGCVEVKDDTTTDGAGGPTKIGGALDLSDVSVAGSVDAKAIEVNGPIRMTRADVRGWVELRDAQIHGPPPPAPAPAPAVLPAGVAPAPLPAPAVAAAPNVVAPAAPNAPVAGTQAPPALYAAGAQIGSQLRLNGAKVWGDVNLSHARIGEGVCAGTQTADGLPDNTPAVAVSGAFYLDSAHMGGSADFRGARIDGRLSLQRASVEGKLRCRLVGDAGRTTLSALDLGDASIHHLDLSSGATPASETLLATTVGLNGCVFHEITVPGDDYAGLFPKHPECFRQESYLAMERWLREHGSDVAAETVYDRMRQHRRSRLGPVAAIGDWITAAARKVSLAFPVLMVISVAAYLLTAAIFSTPRSVVGEEKGSSAPAAASAAPAAKPAPATAEGLVHPRDWGWGDAFLLAAHTHLPMLALPGNERWKPAPAPILPHAVNFRFDAYAFLVSLLSYVLVPLIIGGIATNWLQRRGRS
jgi:uncharacterized protein YjbI with pentapeptide repeats